MCIVLGIEGTKPENNTEKHTMKKTAYLYYNGKTNDGAFDLSEATFQEYEYLMARGFSGFRPNRSIQYFSTYTLQALVIELSGMGFAIKRKSTMKVSKVKDFTDDDLALLDRLGH